MCFSHYHLLFMIIVCDYCSFMNGYTLSSNGICTGMVLLLYMIIPMTLQAMQCTHVHQFD